MNFPEVLEFISSPTQFMSTLVSKNIQNHTPNLETGLVK